MSPFLFIFGYFLHREAIFKVLEVSEESVRITGTALEPGHVY